jgi:hypothetical protein
MFNLAAGPANARVAHSLAVVTHDLDDDFEAERRHQHWYLATCSLAFRFSDEILSSEMI